MTPADEHDALPSIERALDQAKSLARSIEQALDDARRVTRVTHATSTAAQGVRGSATTAAASTTGEGFGATSAGSQRLLSRIVLGDILDDGILSARPQDRAFPLRLFFSELGALLARDSEDGNAIGEHAFTLASGLNFFLRAAMDPEAKVRVGLEVSRQLYTLAAAAALDPELVAKAAPLLATIMSQDLERVVFETVDHARVFDSQVHERAQGSDPSGSRIRRPASFLARVSTNNAVKVKAQVLT